MSETSMRLKSGKVDMGVVGTETDLYDSYGIPLCVGDLVQARRSSATTDLWIDDGPTYVVQSPIMNNGKPFIMGFLNAKRQREFYRDGDPVTADDAEDIYDTYYDPEIGDTWVIYRVKSYLNVVPGERWSNVRAESAT